LVKLLLYHIDIIRYTMI